MCDLIDAMSFLRSNTYLVIIGEGSEEESLRAQTKRLGLDERVHFLPSVNRSQVREFLKLIDIGYAATNKSALYKFGASLTKVNDYMLMGLPIVYAVGDPENAVELSGGGLSCSPGDSNSIASAIDTLAQKTKAELVEIGAKGREWCMSNQLVSEQVKLILERINFT